MSGISPGAEEQRTITTTELVPPSAVRRLAALLDRDAGPILEAGALPPLWHWAVFADAVPQSDLGRDGHPERGGLLSTTEFPRRMFAGGRLWIEGPLRVGAEATCASTITDLTEKQGRRGTLVFVTVRDEITDDGGGRLIEERDLVYLGGPAGGERDDTAPGEPPDAPWTGDVTPDEALLFRFSAVTFNGHRIHYDHPYATGEEGYPALVVHGPLLALLLCELGRAHAGDVREFSFRARRPAFLGDTVRLRGWPEADRADLAAYTSGTEPVMTAALRT